MGGVATAADGGDGRKPFGVAHGEFPCAVAAHGKACEIYAVGVDGVFFQSFLEHLYDGGEFM